MNADQPPPADASLWGQLIASVVFIILSLIFSASESAFLSVNKLRVRFLRNQKDKSAVRAGKLLDKKEMLLNTLLVGNNIVNIALSAILATIALDLFGESGVGIATLFTTIVLLIFGEITPKIIGTSHPEHIAFFFSGFITLLEKILSPFVFVFTGISRKILKLFGMDTQKKNVSFTEDEIRTFMDVGSEAGVIPKGEKTLVRRVFKFTDLSAEDVMIPRTHIVAVSEKTRYNDILELSERTRFSRFPVYRKDIDDIVGIVYVKDLLFYRGRPGAFRVKDVMRPPLFILGTKKMSSIQELFRENNQSIAIVIDEYSGTDGILTREDMAREIFGPIADEYQEPGRATSIRIENPADTTVDGTARLSDLSEALHIPLESRVNETIGGYICEKLDHLAQKDEYIEENGVRFTVTALEGHRVSEVHVSEAGAPCAADAQIAGGIRPADALGEKHAEAAQ